MWKCNHRRGRFRKLLIHIIYSKKKYLRICLRYFFLYLSYQHVPDPPPDIDTEPDCAVVLRTAVPEPEVWLVFAGTVTDTDWDWLAPPVVL